MAAGGLAPRAEPPSELPKYSQPDALLGRNAGTKERSDTEALYLANQGVNHGEGNKMWTN